MRKNIANKITDISKIEFKIIFKFIIFKSYLLITFFLYTMTFPCWAQDANTIKAEELIDLFSKKNDTIDQEQDQPRTIRTRGIVRVKAGDQEGRSDIQSQVNKNSSQTTPSNPTQPSQLKPEQQTSRQTQHVNTGKSEVEVRRSFQNILFDVNAYTIMDSSYGQLDEIGKALKIVMLQDPGAFFIIEGHTDNKGGADYNEKLSTKRAQMVRDFLLLKYGLDRKRLMALGYGENKPIASNYNEYGRSLNRRVEIVKR